MGTALIVDFAQRRLVGRAEPPVLGASGGPLVVVPRIVPFMGIVHPERERVIDLMRHPEAALELGEEEFLDRVLTPLFMMDMSDVYAMRRQDHFDDMAKILYSDHWVVDVTSILGSRSRFDRLKNWVDHRAVMVLKSKGVVGEGSDRYVNATKIAHRLAFQILAPELIDQLPLHQLRVV